MSPIAATRPTPTEVVIPARDTAEGIPMRSHRGGKTIKVIGIEIRLNVATANKIKAIFFFFHKISPQSSIRIGGFKSYKKNDLR